MAQTTREQPVALTLSTRHILRGPVPLSKAMESARMVFGRYIVHDEGLLRSARQRSLEGPQQKP
jgi:hypothetical protein